MVSPAARYLAGPAAAEPLAALRRTDSVARRRLARNLLDAQADFLQRCYLSPEEVAEVLAEVAAQWARDTARRICESITLVPDEVRA